MSDWRDSSADDWNRPPGGSDVPPPPGGDPYGGGYGGASGGGFGTPDPGGATGYAGAGAGPAPEALAGFWIRFGGAVIDGLLLAFVGGIIGAGVGDTGSLLGFVVGAAYFTYLHASANGQTVGNMLCGIRVVSLDDGRSLDYTRAFLRFLMSYVSGFALAIGYLWMLWDPMNQTWHDKVARSVVVKASHHPPPASFGQPSR